MSLKVPERGYFAAFSMLVDINGFTALVANNKLDIGIGTFVRDVFSGAITAVEQNNGAVIGAHFGELDRPFRLNVTGRFGPSCPVISEDRDRCHRLRCCSFKL